MTYEKDLIKVLEIISLELMPQDIFKENQEVTLSEDDFIKEGTSYTSALVLLKDMFTAGYLDNYHPFTDKKGKRKVSFTVTSNIEAYHKGLKYPDGESEGQEDILPRKGPIKISITIDKKKGIYKSENIENCYKIKSSSKRFSLIEKLLHKDNVSINELEENTAQTASLIMKEIKDINTNFRKKLSVGYDLITHINTGGYELNKEMFDIRT